jgi:hypothetical protein
MDKIKNEDWTSEKEYREKYLDRIEKYRDELTQRRGLRENSQFLELNDKGYINALSEVIKELYDIKNEFI